MDSSNYPLFMIGFNITLFLFNGVLGIAMWLLKSSYAEVKEQLKTNTTAIDNVKEHYFKKEDFREFKEELFSRLDEMKSDFREELKRISK